MASNKPVIATGYSGNLEFMPDDYPLLVDYKLVHVGSDAYPYNPDSMWAEPEIDAASELMRRTFNEQAWSRQVAHQFGAGLLNSFSLQQCAIELDAVLEEVE
jgi:glycosyltransferase involved in cell wall biosynthesis